MARELSPEVALSMAMEKLNASQSLRARTLATGATTRTLSLMHTEANEVNVPLYYVYGISDGGFIIAGADDRAESLLGYTESGDFELSKHNLAFASWLDECTKAMEWLAKQPETGEPANAPEPNMLTPVAPLLKQTEWDQNMPYCLYTPEVKDGAHEGHAPTGCVATATAQVMRFWEWPTQGTGQHTNIYFKTQTVDFSKSTYNWAIMKDSYQTDDRGAEGQAVAKLMADVGCALDMQYGPKESGAFNYGILVALADYFKYDKSMTYEDRSYYTTAEWTNKMMDELNAGRPIIFGASASSGGGHAFVLDGYDQNGMFHVNWGWGGSGNGYFNINYLNPRYQGIGGYAGGYSINQAAILGVKPDKSGTSQAKSILKIYKHIRVDEENNNITVSVTNQGLKPFDGLMGFIMFYPDESSKILGRSSFAESPLQYMSYTTLSFNIPQVTQEGCVILPFYQNSSTSDADAIIPFPNGNKRLVSQKLNGKMTWVEVASESVQLEFSKLQVVANYAGFNPKFKFTVKNISSINKDYENYMRVIVHKMVDGEDKIICYGTEQVYLAKDETKEITIETNQTEKEGPLNGKIEVGTYTVDVVYTCGGLAQNVLTRTIDIVETEPCVLSYSDYTVINPVVEVESELKGTMKVKNEGGYDIKTYYFVVVDDQRRIMKYQESSVDLQPYQTTTVEFSTLITLDPGNYYVIFCYLDEKNVLNPLPGAEPMPITVKAKGTAIVDVVNPEGNMDDVLYDINGRPASQLQKGKIYIGRNKVIIR